MQAQGEDEALKGSNLWEGEGGEGGRGDQAHGGWIESTDQLYPVFMSFMLRLGIRVGNGRWNMAQVGGTEDSA